jgi:hypothetical protein
VSVSLRCRELFGVRMLAKQRPCFIVERSLYGSEPGACNLDQAIDDPA